MLPMRRNVRRNVLSLDRFLDRMVEDALAPFGSWPAVWDGRVRPALDVYETPDAVVVKATIPGVKADGLDITLSQGTLVIRGEAKDEREEKEERYYLRERRSGAFHRAVTLPVGLDTKKAEATFEDGVLTISLPKTEEAKPQEIKVKVKEASK